MKNIRMWTILMGLVCMTVFSTAQRTASAQGTAPEMGVTVSEPLSAGESAELENFRARVSAANPDMEVVSVSGGMQAQLAPIPKPVTPTVAIFVKNQSTKKNLNDEVDALRDMISAELAGLDMIILDPSEIVESFHRYKVTTDEERLGLIDGLFTGGSAVRVAQMIGADYLILISLNYADVRSRVVSGDNVNIYQVTLSAKVLEAGRGSSVFGNNFQEKYPSQAASGSADDMTYFHDLFLSSAQKIGTSLAGSAPRWRRAAPVDSTLVSFTVKTTIDELIGGLETGVRAPNELLDEMRRQVGGVTVELDGVALGSSPGTFQASPGLHRLRVTRQWMQPVEQTVSIKEGYTTTIALELSDEGLAKFKSLEGFKAMAALTYAEAAYKKGIKINYDTAAWRDVSIGTTGTEINLEKNEIEQRGAINQLQTIEE